MFLGSRDGNFYGIRLDGTPVPGTPVPTGDGIFSTAAAGDLDGDGDIEIAFASYDGSVNVLDFGGAATPGALPWPTYAGNNLRTSVFGEPGDPIPGVDPPLSASAFSLAPAVPSPFRSRTTIDWAVPRDMAVSLVVYDVSGRRVRTLVAGPVAAGPNEACWDGRDESGRPASAGVYFCRLRSEEGTLTRKVVRLR